jgi:serine/threonine protein kinase/Tfp pilus assembly protein PilF
MSCLLRAGIGSEEETVHDSRPDALKGGLRFGVYEIDRREDGSLYELGRGAMGITYRATDTSLQRKVALKIIKTDIAERSADARERFIREARAAAALRHENIAVIHQFGMSLETGQYFYAMELIEGETLEERVRCAGPLDARTTIEIAQQVTSALAAAEKHGLVHRDLKPANLMLVSPDGETSNNKKPLVKIIDFGLAKAIDSQIDPKSLTHDRFVGTPAFASPEQFEHSALDVRSDIYSLGETLWFALTGKTPFAGRSMEEIHRAQKSNALTVEQLKAAHVPHRLKSLLESMLAFEPASRPGTHELAVRLQRCSSEARTVRRTRVALAAAALVVLGISALFVFQPPRIQNAPLNPAPDKSIAVLPFENRSEDKANAHFADGIQDEILTRLSKIADLKVISRTSTQHYKSTPKNLPEIAKQLGVAHILEGSVQRSGDAVRVNVQLIKAANDSHLWADTFDRKLTDIFAVESEIAKGIAESLQAKLTGREKQALAVKPTNNPEAYDAYLHGLAYALRPGYYERNTLAAVEHFREAVKLDPEFAVAWAWLARVSALGYANSAGNKVAALRETAKDAVAKVTQLQPNLGETFLAQGYFHYYCEQNYDAAIASFEKARQLAPKTSDALEALALVSRLVGRWQQSLEYFRQATEIDPRNTSLLDSYGGTYVELREYPSALKVYDQLLEISPDNVEALVSKAAIYQCAANLSEAATLLSRVPPDPSSPQTFVVQIWQRIYERRFPDAIAMVKDAIADRDLPSTPKRYYGWTLADLKAFTGDTTGARTALQQLRDEVESSRRQLKEEWFSPDVLAEANAALGDQRKALAII